MNEAEMVYQAVSQYMDERGTIEVMITSMGIDVPKWTTTPPTEPGQYWGWSNELSDKEAGPAMLTVWEVEPLAITTPDGQRWEESDWDYWLGPLPVPEPPT